MSDTAIKVENLSKLYHIGLREQKQETFIGALASWAKSPWTNYKRLQRLTQFDKRGSGSLPPFSEGTDLIWALKDVSFEVNQSEVVGIIGRNGAGKSTLLKVLSRITEPTSGHALINGRVASLLEVGTGFHPELTGRENIYLNGTILGMTRIEVDRKFDEIVDFAEIEKFIDTPVKHYSSGMYVRLAFAVAAHLEPEILLIDEVLAVGDTSFQQKCLGKMGDVAKTGRTILFVSHQMNQIRRLCEKCIWLCDGEIHGFGKTVNTISSYEAAPGTRLRDNVIQNNRMYGSTRFIGWDSIEPLHEPPNVLTTVGPVKLRFVLQVGRHIHKGRHGIALFNNESQLMWATAFNDIELEPGASELTYFLPTIPVRPGVYYWHVTMYDENELTDAWTGVPELLVATKPSGHALDTWQGILNLQCVFDVRQTYGRSMGV
jgi:lipopolysaccharide transport system ATP-binding protein